jgi:hypothetical protein
MLEGFPPVDENDGDVELKSFEQPAILLNVHFREVEADSGLYLLNDPLRLLAKGAIWL